MFEWNTTISARDERGELVVRGHRLEDLIRSRSFLEVVFLLIRGDLPRPNEAAMLGAMLVAICDHGAEPPSTVVTRIVTSAGNPMNAALAAGLLSMGDRHAGAVSAAMEMLGEDQSAEEVVRSAILLGRRVSGFGHKVYKEEDPRTRVLLEKALELGLHGIYVKRALAIETVLEKEKGKRLPLNIDGVLAALLLELNIPSAAGNAIFMLGRLPGLIAHALEEQSETTYRRVGN